MYNIESSHFLSYSVCVCEVFLDIFTSQIIRNGTAYRVNKHYERPLRELAQKKIKWNEQI